MINNWSLEGLLENIGLKKTTYGIAFSGGGARGFAHIGVIMAMEKFGIRPSIVSGVSAGSIAAVLYTSGLTPKEIIDCFNSHLKFSDFMEWGIPKEGILKLDRFAKTLESWLDVKNLEDLTMPTLVCATDFDNGKCKAWVKGPIVERVIASCSIPIVFNPVTIDGIKYVDGGVLRNLPAWAIRDYCTTLIGSNCNPPERRVNSRNSILDIAVRSYRLMSKANVPQDIRLCDIVIQSDDLTYYKTFGISQMKKILLCGYDAACAAFEKYLSNQ